MDERTNATFYTDVRIPDRYRMGEVNAGAKVLAAALSLEHGGGHFHEYIREMTDEAVTWARETDRDGHPAIEDADVLARLAATQVHVNVGEGLSCKAVWTRLAKEKDLAYGPASKVFSTEAFITDSADLLDMTAPHSLLRGKDGLSVIEKGYRHATATTIYGGTSEVMRSMIAERRLGLPRSRG
jgi:alkylation response protein AidB-like acyl-CoA dehydrogenase